MDIIHRRRHQFFTIFTYTPSSPENLRTVFNLNVLFSSIVLTLPTTRLILLEDLFTLQSTKIVYVKKSLEHLGLSPRPATTHPPRARHRRHVSHESSPLAALDTPMETTEDLTLAQVKLLKKLFNRGPDAFRLVVEAYNGKPCDEARLQRGVKRLLRDKVSSPFHKFDCRN